MIKQLIAVFWGTPSSATGRMVGLRPYCASARRLFYLVAYSSYRRLVPESVNAGKSYFQVELEGEVHDSPRFSVLGQTNGRRFYTVVTDVFTESIRQPDAVSNSRPPATGVAQELTATTTRIEFVTQTIVTPVPDLCEFYYVPIQAELKPVPAQEIDEPALPALSPSLESSSWLPRLPAKPVVRLDSHGPNVVGVVVVIMAVLFALAAVGALVTILRGRFKRGRRHGVMSPRCGGSTADDRLTYLPDKKPSAAPAVQYLPNLHSLGIHTASAGSYSRGTNPRMSLDDVRLTPRINPFPSPKDGGGFDKGPTNIACRGGWQWSM